MKGHIRKRGLNSWAIVIDMGRDQDGKRVQKWHSVRGKKKDAETEMRRLLTSLDAGMYVEPNKLTVSEYLTQWLDLVQPHVEEKTFWRYEIIAKKHLTPALGHHRLLKLNALHIENYYAAARINGRIDGKGGLSEQTLLHHHRVLKEALQKAVRLKLRANNPADDVDAPRPIKKQVTALDEAQTATLLRALEGRRMYVPVLLAVTTGLRLGEVLGLQWQDIDLAAGQLRVRRTVQRVKKKLFLKERPKSKSSARTVALPSLTVEALRRHKAEQSKERLLIGPGYADQGLVFAREDGSLRAPETLSRSVADAAKSLGFAGVTFHSLRHSHATHMLRQNVHMKIASERLGHSTIKITMDLYSHMLDGMQDEAANKVDAALRSALDGKKGA